MNVELDRVITPELELEGIAREVIRTANALRKEAGLSINNSAELFYSSNKLDNVFDKFGKNILKETLCAKYKIGNMELLNFKKEIIVNDEIILIGIKII